MQAETPPSLSASDFRVGDRLVHPGLNRIDGPAGPVQVEPKVMEVLVHLAGRHGEVVSKEELVRVVWEGRFVSDDVVWRSIRELRRALGDDARSSTWIETIPRRGYRLLEPLPEPSLADSLESQGGGAGEERGGQGVRAPRLIPRRLLGLSLLLGFALIAAIVLPGVRRLETVSRAPARPQRVRLAVLPFVNLSGDPSQDYFGDGITEELIARLGSLAPDRLGVIGRTSVMSFKGKDTDLAGIARALDADYLVEGSVRRDGARVRVAVRLIQASDQSSLWSDLQDLDAQGVLGLESHVAKRVVRALSPELLPGRTLSLAASTPAAHDAVLRGRYFLSRGMPDDLRRSADAFREALALDQGSAAAWAGLADALHLQVLFGAVSPREGVPPAEEAARKALALDDMLADTHATLGTIRFRYHWDWTGAETEMRRALEINPSSAAAHHDLAWLLLAERRFDEAIAEIRAAQELEPLSVRANADVGWVYYRARRYGEAVRQMERTLEMEPRFLSARRCLEGALVRVGRPEQAFRHARVAALQEGLDPAELAGLPSDPHVALERLAKRRLKHLIGRGSTVYVSPYALAALYLESGEQDEALAALTRALAERDPMLVSLDVDPAFDPIRADPRFQEIVATVGGPGSRRPS
ncbi:MAG TPA: winged helix-turn-helix domain-containing protein [Thermoanaerobaculia bacterium]|nr:winged helix-turn-helix domain-containing protein [Thermoanaerobaculia bacterium]